MLTLLLDHGADINDKGADLVRAAVRHNQEETLAFLLQRVAVVLPDVVSVAIELKHPRLVELLISSPVDLNHGAVHAAISSSQLDVLGCLLRGGADPNCLHQGVRPLHLTVRDPSKKDSGKRDAKGQVVAAGTTDGNTSAALTVPEFMDMTRLLLEAHADPNARDATGTAPIHLACHSADLLQLLINYGAEKEAVDARNSQTALHVAR